MTVAKSKISVLPYL